MKFKLFIKLLCINCILIRINAFPVQDEEQGAQNLEQLDYLSDLEDLSTAVIGPEAVSSAIKEFQGIVGLNETGELDSDTIAMMQVPRYEIKENAVAISARKKRFADQGNKRYTRLTYRITKYPANLNDRKKVDGAIASSFKMWSDVAPINFEEKKQGDVNIDIRFEISYHGDGFAFDRPRIVLGRASSLAKNSGINKIQVPAYESENSLGLSHSKENQALMAPTYLVYQPTFVLHVDDIKSIADLYGTKDQVTEEPAGPSPDAPDLCQDPSIDTITRTQSGDTYVFKGDFYWKIYNGIADGYPRRIDDDWLGLEGNLDASITFHGKTYFFKGIHYWSFTNKIMDKGYPQLISQRFRGLPDNLDAACVWSGNGQMYFFKGDHYWKYNDNENPPVNRGYPTPLYKWRGLPNNLDAAVLWDNNMNYFFKGDQYYRFNDTRDTVDPQYPLPTAKYWFGCDGNTSYRSIKK